MHRQSQRVGILNAIALRMYCRFGNEFIRTFSIDSVDLARLTFFFESGRPQADPHSTGLVLAKRQTQLAAY